MSYREYQSAFESDGVSYDLNYLFAATENLPVVQIHLSSLTWVLKGQMVDAKRMLKSDVTVPILVTTHKGRQLVVDGLHRLLHAQMLKLDSIPAKVVSKEVMARSRIKQKVKVEYGAI